MRAPPIALLLAAASPSFAWAGNQDTVPMGDLAAIAAAAVVAARDDSGSVAYNPAGLAGIDRDRLSISASLYQVKLIRIPGYLHTETPDGPVDAPAARTLFETIPPAIIAARKLGPSLAWALSLTVPMANVMNSDRRTEVSGPAFDLRQSARSATAIQLYRVGGTVAWQPLRRLRVGATLNLALLRSNEFFAFELSAHEASDRRTYVNSERSQQGNVGAVGGIVGVQWLIARHWAAGLAIEPPLLGVFGSLDTDETRFLARTSPGQPGVVVDEVRSQSDSLAGNQLGRFVARLGLAYTIDRGWISAQVDYRPKPLLSLPWREDSVTNFRAGAVYALSQAIRVGAGAFTDFDTAAPAADMHFDFLGGTAGVMSRRHLALADARGSLVLGTTLGVRYAYGWGTASAISANPTSDDPNQFVTTTSTRGTVHELSAYIGAGVDY